MPTWLAQCDCLRVFPRRICPRGHPHTPCVLLVCPRVDIWDTRGAHVTPLNGLPTFLRGQRALPMWAACEHVVFIMVYAMCYEDIMCYVYMHGFFEYTQTMVCVHTT